MIRKYHNHTLHTNPWHHEEESQNIQSNKTSAIQQEQSNQLSQLFSLFIMFCIHLTMFRVLFMHPKELWEAYSNRTVRPSVSPSVRPSVRPSRFRVRSISPIFFEVGIPNLVCGYILGWRSVAYHFRVTVTLTLTSDLVSTIIVSGAYLRYYLR